MDFKGFKWMIQTTDYHPVESVIGISLNPEDIHIMKKSKYSGMFGDYSSYSEEFDEMANPEIDLTEESGGRRNEENPFGRRALRCLDDALHPGSPGHCALVCLYR